MLVRPSNLRKSCVAKWKTDANPEDMGDANLSNPNISCRRWTRATRCLTRIAQRRWPVWPADQSRSNYQYYCIDSNQILRNTEDHKVFIVGGPNTCPKIQDDGRPPFWKNVKSPYLRNRFLTDFDEIWHGDEYWSPTTGDRPLKFGIFENSRWRRPPSWKSQQSRYLSNGLVDQSRPLQSIVNVFRPTKVTSSYYTKRPTLSNTNPTVDVPLQFFLSPELEKSLLDICILKFEKKVPLFWGYRDFL